MKPIGFVYVQLDNIDQMILDSIRSIKTEQSGLHKFHPISEELMYTGWIVRVQLKSNQSSIYWQQRSKFDLKKKKTRTAGFRTQSRGWVGIWEVSLASLELSLSLSLNERDKVRSETGLSNQIKFSQNRWKWVLPRF